KQYRWENRQEYAKLLEEYHLNEFNSQIDAIRQGLATVVPIAFLPLFSWRELELMVCSEHDIDLELLKDNTTYKSGVSASDRHVQYFWSILQEFSTQQRHDFLRFVWGQSRLPARGKDFLQKFEIQTAIRDGDNALPVSHTCFFSLELPRYSSKEIMKKKLLYAISNCHAIDADFLERNVNWEEN
ncbi:ubiquitin protein ligase, partial [Reticulomyxa filosa]